MRFEGKSVFVTGAGSGLGRAAAVAFAGEGASLTLLDLSADAARETASLIAQGSKGRTLPLAADVADSAAVQTAVAASFAAFGPIDVLFNNAGIAIRNPVTEQDEAGWDEVLRVNLRGVFICSKYALPHLRRPGGVIVNTSSIVGLVGVRNRAAYAASKGAVVTLTKNMALDYAPQGIRVNAVCPGFVRTPMTAGLFSDSERERKVTAMHPLGRLATPEDIARAVLFLASDDASFITGQALAVDGGFTVGRPEDV